MEALLTTCMTTHRTQLGLRPFPAKAAAAWTEDLLAFLLDTAVSAKDGAAPEPPGYHQLQERLLHLLEACLPEAAPAELLCAAFFDSLPDLYPVLLADAQAILDFDPAATSLGEVLIAYPGFYAVAVYRLAHRLHQLGIPLLPRICSAHAQARTGIDIHPAAVIGHPFLIDHGTGIVIGATAEIGDRVKIYQGVTLGALHVRKTEAAQKRHPTIGNDVIIYAGATILGGDTLIGENSVIGGNVWLTESIAPASVVYQQNRVVVRGRDPLPEPLNFII